MSSRRHPSLLRLDHGFTLVELLIAMLITVAMVGVVSYLFGQIQRGTGVSLARAQLITTAATVDSRLRIDTQNMAGPDRSTGAGAVAGGALVIVPGLREGYMPLSNGQMSRNKVRLRSDQLVFFSKRDQANPWNPAATQTWKSMLPLAQNATPNTSGVSTSTSWEARIWYGAVKDGNTTGGDGTSADSGLSAHLWLVGRQAKLLVQDQKAGAMDCTVTPGDDTTAGSLVKPVAAAWSGVKDAALAGGWTDDDYVANLIGSGITTAEQKNRGASIPVTTPTIDLKQLQHSANPKIDLSGVQLSDLAQSHLRLFENCSEIVVQWAGDLDKDGKIDTYPAGHPLAGAIIWYPEELHTNAQKDVTTKPRLSGTLLAKYNAIAANPWATKSFPTGFAPALGAWPNGRFGGGAWPARFQFDYGETDNAPNQAGNAAANIPLPYVFRFDDDQYRLVRHGFRQDGSNYKNKWDGKPLPNAALGNRHYFPYPPTTGVGMSDGFGTYYNGKAPPAGPYPAAAVNADAAKDNFGDLMGGSCLPGDCNTRQYRTAGNGIVGDPNQYGYLVTVSNAAIPAASGGSNAFSLPGGAMTLAIGAASAAGAEPLWPYYSGGNLVAIRQVDGAILASVAKPAGDATPDTVPLPSAANQVGAMAQQFGPGNNFTATYTDIWAEYLKTLNDPTKAADSNPKSREDWRMPQSDWPRLIRIRVRLHDAQGLVSSYSDEFLVNGRDDDGDGRVDNPDEGRMSGMWFEYVFAVPYPVDPIPRAH